MKTKRFRWWLFLAFGLTRRYGAKSRRATLLGEPDGARTSRRNVIALSGSLVLAGGLGVAPSDISILGVKPGEGFEDVLVISVAVIAAQVYWYVQKAEHIGCDGLLEHQTVLADMQSKTRTTSLAFENIDDYTIIQKSPNWLSNYLAFWLTGGSWWFIANWLGKAWCS